MTEEEKMESDVKAFLKNGGKVEVCESLATKYKYGEQKIKEAYEIGVYKARYRKQWNSPWSLSKNTGDKPDTGETK